MFQGKLILPNINHEAFDKLWNEEQQKAYMQLVKEENLSTEKTEKIIEDYLFAEREPLRDEVLELIEGNKPTVLERKKVGDRILSKIIDFVETFINGIQVNKIEIKKSKKFVMKISNF